MVNEELTARLKETRETDEIVLLFARHIYCALNSLSGLVGRTHIIEHVRDACLKSEKEAALYRKAGDDVPKYLDRAVETLLKINLITEHAGRESWIKHYSRAKI